MNHNYFLKMAYEYGSKFSTDPSTQNGVVLVKDEKIVVQSANHFPKNIREFPERWNRPLKYCFVEHAERNAIYTAAKEGIKTENLWMYAPWAACTDCMRAIIQSGISKLIVHHDPLDLTRFDMSVSEQWRESIKIAIEMLHESDVELLIINDKLFNDDFKIRFNGNYITP